MAKAPENKNNTNIGNDEVKPKTAFAETRADEKNENNNAVGKNPKKYSDKNNARRRLIRTISPIMRICSVTERRKRKRANRVRYQSFCLNKTAASSLCPRFCMW